MRVDELLDESLDIWGKVPLSLKEVITLFGVVYGDICKDSENPIGNAIELKKEFGNIIFSTIKWSYALGFDPEECISLAIEAQRQKAVKTPQTKK